MKNINSVMKRVLAYIIDIMIVMYLSLAISYIPLFQKDMDKYESKYNEYEEKYNNLKEVYDLLVTSYEDNEISEEEYNELIKNETYQKIITESYEDKKISEGEYKKITKQLTEDNTKLANNYNYILGKISISDTIITLVCTLLYFGVLQYLLKGQTIGKKILKLKVVSASEKNINIINYLLRSLIVNNVLLNVIGVIFLFFSSKSTYLNVDNILNTIVGLVEAIIIFLVLTREDQRGLHDLLFNTKVISTTKEVTPNKNLDNDDKKVIEVDTKSDYKEESSDGKQKTRKRKGKK